MNSSIMVDMISVLPKNIIDSILTHLPILEAVRTSILSRSWRYHWHSLLKIEINHRAFPFHNDQLQESHAAFNNKIVKIIDHILLLHCGSVDKFELNINLEACNDIDRWILYVSRNGIKELIINIWDGLYNLPSCIFSCSDLTHLEMTKCILKPPPAFKAFCNLRELSFNQVVITDKGLQDLLKSCPLLSNLSLSEINPPPSLKLNAPNLVMLYVNEFYCFPQFMNTPLLTSASFGLECHISSDNNDCKMIELFGSMPILQRLEIFGRALQHLAVGDIPARLPLVCPIKFLRAYIDFEDLQELLAAFCIFRSSPFIRGLDITADSTQNTLSVTTGFWKGEHDFSFAFYLLQVVEVYCFSGIESELEFIKFLLSNAPTLQIIFIEFSYFVEDLLPIVTKLARFPRISPNAELILEPAR